MSVLIAQSQQFFRTAPRATRCGFFGNRKRSECFAKMPNWGVEKLEQFLRHSLLIHATFKKITFFRGKVHFAKNLDVLLFSRFCVSASSNFLLLDNLKRILRWKIVKVDKFLFVLWSIALRSSWATKNVVQPQTAKLCLALKCKQTADQNFFDDNLWLQRNLRHKSADKLFSKQPILRMVKKSKQRADWLAFSGYSAHATQ